LLPGSADAARVAEVLVGVVDRSTRRQFVQQGNEITRVGGPPVGTQGLSLLGRLHGQTAHVDLYRWVHHIAHRSDCIDSLRQ
ncbi:MAG: hypothetical protein RJB08_1736, partial [Actinomycetota bacterium]